MRLPRSPEGGHVGENETANLRAPAASPARRWVRRLGTLLLMCGLAAIAWTATVWLWQDPVTGLSTWYQQRGLSSSLERQLADPLSRIRLPAVLRSHGREAVELQACHPRFFATNRYVVYGRPVRIAPHGGRPFTPTRPD